MDTIKAENRRKYFRIECAAPICSEVTIIKINNQVVNTGTTRVCVEDIGPGGLKFISKLDLPVNPNFIVKFYTVILNEPLLLEGFVVRKEEIESGIYQYGVRFIIEDSEVRTVTKLLNELDYAARKGIKNTGSNFCIKSKMECFRLQTISSEKRAFLRFQCPSPLCSKLIVKRINNKVINSEGDRVCIEDIGQGGLRFISHMDYPVIKDIEYEFQMIVVDQRLFLKGYINRKKEIEAGIYEYGVKFNILDAQKQEISDAIEAMQKEVNKRFWFKKSSFCIKNKMDCLRSRNAG